MKRFLSSICYLAIISSAFAQDIIILKDGKEISSKILEVNVGDIKYKKADNLDGPTYTVIKSEVFILKYANGTKDVVAQDSNTQSSESQSSTAEDMYFKGMMDGERFYRDRGAGTGTLITTLTAGGIIGLIPAIICSSTKPKDRSLRIPNPSLGMNTSYYNGYVHAAKKKKIGRVWMNWGIGCVINVGAFFIINSTLNNTR